MKYVITLVIIISLSIWFGRTVALITLFVSLIPLIYIHGVVLPKKGINGWTGEPKSKYCFVDGTKISLLRQRTTQKVR